MGGACEEVPQMGGESAEMVAGCAQEKKTGIEDDVGLLGPMIGDNNLTVSY